MTAILKSNDSTTADIPLSQLVAWSGNVRKTTNDNGLAELAASIHAHGLLQPPIVRITGDEETGLAYSVVAGKRRLLALQKLANENLIDPAGLIPCRIIGADEDADEISLVENVVREDMHPADQFEAFKALIDKDGASITDIAARFGVSETVVKKRLLMAALAPEILQAFRDGKITLAMAQAFTVTEDHKRQLDELENIDEDTTPEDIRDSLTDGRIAATDKRVRFVTLPIYEQAGGIVSRDLFSTEDSGIFIENVALLDQLVQQQLDAAAEALRAKGWSWVDITLDNIYKYAAKHKLRAVNPDAHEPITSEAQAEIDRLQAEYDKIETDSGDRDYTREENKRRVEITRLQEKLEDTAPIWTDEQKATYGIVLEIDHNGNLEENHFIRPGTKDPASSRPAAADDNDGDGDDDEGEPGDISSNENNGSGFELPRALINTLSEHRTAALAAKLAEKPDLALGLACWALGDSMLYEEGVRGYNELFEFEATDNLNNLSDDDITPETCKGFAEMCDNRRAWDGKIPSEPQLFLEWCVKQKRQTLLNLFAYLFAKTVDATCFNSKRLPEADILHDLVELDMAEFFTPTTENYFKHVGKATILANLTEALNLTEIPDAWAKLPHAKLAEIAEREIAGTGWIPEPLRAPPLPGEADETTAASDDAETDEDATSDDDGDDQAETTDASDDEVEVDIVVSDDEAEDEDDGDDDQDWGDDDDEADEDPT